MQIARISALALAFAGLPCAVSAEVLNYEFAGTVTSSTYVAQPGEKVTGTFSFDSGTPPVGTCFNNACSYADPRGSMTMQVGAHRMSGAGSHVRVENDQGIAGYEDIVKLGSGSPVVIDGTTYAVGGMMLWLVSSKPQVLDGTGVPRDYQVHRFDIVREGGFSTGGPNLEDTLVYFRLDSLKLVQPAAR
jgi:hypothetical protein